MTTRPFRHFVNDPRFARVPMILETEKGKDERGRSWDRMNLARLRRLVKTNYTTETRRHREEANETTDKHG